MTLAVVEWKAARARLMGEPRRLIFWSALTAIVIVSLFIHDLLPWADEYPKSWVVPFRGWAGDFMYFLVKRLDFGLFTFLEATREVLNEHGGLWFQDESFVVSRRRG